MSLRKLCFFTMLAMSVVGAIASASLKVPVNGFHVPRQNSWPRDAVLAPLGSKTGNPPMVFLPVQSKNAEDLHAGSVLVASRGLADPHFAKTVILLVHSDAEGVVGLILNRRTDVPLSRVLGGLKAARDRSDQVYLGGPVGTEALFALLESGAKVDGAEHIFGGVYLISNNALFERTISTRPDPSIFHVYLGYAGWSPAQLRAEVELGAWFIFPADAKTVFDADPDSLWPQMIHETELDFARGSQSKAREGPCCSLLTVPKKQASAGTLFDQIRSGTAGRLSTALIELISSLRTSYFAPYYTHSAAGLAQLGFRSSAGGLFEDRAQLPPPGWLY